MYVTRPFSKYKKFASELSSPPPEGPDSGILVIQDEEPEVIISCCFGLCKLKDYSVRELPFPQNKELLLRYRVVNREEDNPREYDYYPVLLIPVHNQPLSSNRYYAIQSRGRHKGYALFLFYDIHLIPFDKTYIFGKFVYYIFMITSFKASKYLVI